MAKVGIDIAGEQPKKLTDDAVVASDVVITMGCGDECPYFPGKRYGRPMGQISLADKTSSALSCA